MINYDKVAEKIFAIIKGFGYNLSMFTIDGMDTSVPSDGRRFYVKKPNFMVTLDEENDEIKINKNSHVTLEEIESVMKQLKNLAKQNLLNTQIKVFGKEITPKDFAYQAQKFKDNTMENVVSEASLSRMSGSKKTSYQTLESVKLIVRHRKPVAEEMRGSRSRQIQAIFLEQGGERVRFPHNNLIGARAMARHMYEGGSFEDTLGIYIVESVGNILKLNEFVRYARSNKLMNETNTDVVKTVKENMAVLRKELHGLTGAKTYARISEKIAAREVDVLEEDDTTELQDMFTVKKFDEKLGDTLPLVRKLMNEKQAWRNALIEASTQTILMHEKEELAEDDIMEFDSPIQQVGYKIKRVANRMVETGDLQRFVGKIASKLIEGQDINEFEKTVVRNVLENATIKEETCCEECDCEPCECNTFESVVEGFALKIKMLEHEDIFELDRNTYLSYMNKSAADMQNYAKQGMAAEIDGDDELADTHMSRVNKRTKGIERSTNALLGPRFADDEELAPYKGDLALARSVARGQGDMLGDVLTDDLEEDANDNWGVGDYVVTTWEEPNKYSVPLKVTGVYGDQVRVVDDYGNSELMSPNDLRLAPSDVSEDEGEKCIRCRKGTMQPGDTMMGPAKECDHCNYQQQVNEAGGRFEDDDHDCTVGDGYCDTCGAWMDPAGGIHDKDEEDPAAMYEMTDRMRKLAGLSEGEIPDTDCKHCSGSGNEPDMDVTGALDKCSECGGNGLAESAEDGGNVDPEDFMDDCPDCGGNGKAKDSIFDDAECKKCGGEGYV